MFEPKLGSIFFSAWCKYNLLGHQAADISRWLFTLNIPMLKGISFVEICMLFLFHKYSLDIVTTCFSFSIYHMFVLFHMHICTYIYIYTHLYIQDYPGIYYIYICICMYVRSHMRPFHSYRQILSLLPGCPSYSLTRCWRNVVQQGAVDLDVLSQFVQKPPGWCAITWSSPGSIGKIHGWSSTYGFRDFW